MKRKCDNKWFGSTEGPTQLCSSYTVHVTVLDLKDTKAVSPHQSSGRSWALSVSWYCGWNPHSNNAEIQWKWKSGSTTLPVIESWCWPEGDSPLLLFHGSNISTSSWVVFARMQGGWSVEHQGTHSQFRAWILCQDLWPTFQTRWLTQTEHEESMEDPETGTSARRQRWTSEDGEAASQLGAQNSRRNLHNKNNEQVYLILFAPASALQRVCRSHLRVLLRHRDRSPCIYPVVTQLQLPNCSSILSD